MVTFTCDRCHKHVNALWRVELHFSTVEIDSSPEGEFGKVSAEVCEECSDALEVILASECGKSLPKEKKK